MEAVIYIIHIKRRYFAIFQAFFTKTVSAARRHCLWQTAFRPARRPG